MDYKQKLMTVGLCAAALCVSSLGHAASCFDCSPCPFGKGGKVIELRLDDPSDDGDDRTDSDDLKLFDCPCGGKK